MNRKTEPLRFSRWLEVAVLLSEDEFAQLLAELHPFHHFRIGQVLEIGQHKLSHEELLHAYQVYIRALSQGQLPDLQLFRQQLTGGWSQKEDAVASHPLPDGKVVLQLCQPVVQVRPFQVAYSAETQTFLPQGSGPSSFSWGLQFSYPQLMQDPATQQIVKVLDPKRYPNVTLFRRLQRWVRHHSLPTSFQIDGSVRRQPFRLGRDCETWIEAHPQQPTGLEFARLLVSGHDTNRSDRDRG